MVLMQQSTFLSVQPLSNKGVTVKKIVCKTWTRQQHCYAFGVG